MTSQRGIKKATAVFLALALGACAMNAQQQGQSTRPATATGNGPVAASSANDLDDPNLPGQSSPGGLEVGWVQNVRGYPVVLMASSQDRTYKQVHYIGWNDQGSWLGSNGKIYVWNLSKKSLTKMYDNASQIPQETLASMHNLKDKQLLANYTPHDITPKPTGPKPETPDTSRQAAFFGGGNISQAAVPGAIAGSGATIQNGILTFTRADNTKANYKVIRPKVAQGAPGNTGAWISTEDGGKGILFTVNMDNSVTGREMPAQIIQALTQGTPQR